MRACRSAEEVERAISAPVFDIVAREPVGGSQGAAKLTLEGPSGIVVAKWRAAANSDAYNQPAAALGAYRLQRLVLTPREYVIPPTASHCFPLQSGLGEPVLAMDCVLGFLSVWLSHAIPLREARRRGIIPAPGGVWDPDPALYDADRWAHESARYRGNIAHLNVIAFLARNGDTHAAQFVLYRKPQHVFLVDNSVAFSGLPRPAMRGRQNFAELIVPAIPADTAARLLRLDERGLRDLLRLEEYVRRDGHWVRTRPGPLLDGGRGRVRRHAMRVQIGLSVEDVAVVVERLRELKAALRSGRLATFR